MMVSDEEFLRLVKIFKPIGYGRMMQIISHEWHEHEGTGALTVGDAVGVLPEEERQKYEAVKKVDPVFR